VPEKQPKSNSSAPSSEPASPSKTSQPHPRKRHVRKKKSVSNTNCPASPDISSASAASSQDSSECHPAKKVVRNGGVSEPAVQLKGGRSAEQASHERDTTDQLLASTEGQLKKTEGQKLNSNQQEVVDQIHQFMDQSKAAVATGDLERARNLALKARLLSDELVSP
jgi:hypothetical protein